MENSNKNIQSPISFDQVAPNKTTNSHQLILYTVITSLILSVGILSYEVYTLKTASPTISETANQPQLSPAPTTMIDPTADWKTYTSPNWGFSFRYPNDLNVIDNQSSVNVIAPNSDVLYLNVYIDPNTTVEKIVKNLHNFTDTFVNNYPAKEIDNSSEGQTEKRIYLSNHSTVYDIEINSSRSGGAAEIADQILSTFKFTDSASSIPANWKTYTNPTYKFSFKYPSDFINRSPESSGILASFTNSINNLDIKFDNTYFSLESLHRYAPTGSESVNPDLLTVGNNVFYYYGPGGGGVCYPDQFFTNLNGKILIFNFTGCENDKTPSQSFKATENQILSTFKFTP
jgi:hypothetical protein